MPSTTKMERNKVVFGIVCAISWKQSAELFKNWPTISEAMSILADRASNCSAFSESSNSLVTIFSGSNVVPLKNPLEIRVVRSKVALADDNTIMVN